MEKAPPAPAYQPPTYQPAPGPVPGPAYQPAPMVVQQQPMVAAQPAQVVLVGGCPSCKAGVLQEDFTCCGICLGICFFPIGLLCCFLMKEKKCTNCGAKF